MFHKPLLDVMNWPCCSQWLARASSSIRQKILEVWGERIPTGSPGFGSSAAGMGSEALSDPVEVTLPRCSVGGGNAGLHEKRANAQAEAWRAESFGGRPTVPAAHDVSLSVSKYDYGRPWSPSRAATFGVDADRGCWSFGFLKRHPCRYMFESKSHNHHAGCIVQGLVRGMLFQLDFVGPKGGEVVLSARRVSYASNGVMRLANRVL
ncbi:hypothetical protein LX32DRAFT_654043 [Colletotrichum zoysiae]|uniref:Uncharacterized protein n=1 Tax=Colletotrichum zoysiae TaxID=1216348 RepID=A0AAD9HFR8_9PEZI|nr:hypothetical protein LX32DRAFT_654043 [Colletotrichum zoysiae]